MLLKLIMTSALLMGAVAPAAATPTTTTRRENKSAELEEEGMFSLLANIVHNEIVRVKIDT